MTDIDLRGVSKRDLDLFLLEEVVASDAFRSWFLSRIDLDRSAVLIQADRSVVTSTGESDLEFTYEDGSGSTVRVLVENKVDAVFQDRQPERYAERAEAYVQAGECDETRTVLFAPDVYSSDDAGFEYQITYEEVRTQLKSRPNADARDAYKLALLDAAIHRGSSGWTLEPDAALTAFWHGYWSRAASSAPELQMPKPDPKPATSTFYFRPSGLDSGIRLVHKLTHGNVDLQFAGMADSINEFRTRYSPALEEGMSIVSAGESAAIRIEVPPIQPDAPIEQSEIEVERGLDVAKQLLEWYRRHAPGI